MTPLSFAQARLWILDRLQPGNPAYNIPAPLRLPGRIDTRVLETTLNEIVRRHEVLRTSFIVIDGKPQQLVAPILPIGLEIIDLRQRPRAVRDQELNALIFEEGRKPFDLGKAPLLRATLIRLGPTDHLLMLVMHHIVSDGWSMSVLFRELSTLYTAFLRGRPSPLPDLPIQYSDFADWQSKWFRGDVLRQQLGFWSEQLAGLRPVLDLPTDRPRPPVQTNRGAVHLFSLDEQLCADLRALGRAHGATFFMTMLAAFKILLHRLSGETDIAVGSPIANRARPELEGMIGFFVNTLVLRTDLSGEPTFLDVLTRERTVALDAYENQDMPFEKLVEELRPDRDLSHNALFQILFAVQNIGTVDRTAPAARPAKSGSQAGATGNGTAKFDLTMSLMDMGSGTQGCLEFNIDLFEAETVSLIIERYLVILQQVVDHPEAPISRLSIWTAEERETPGDALVGPTVEDAAPTTICALVAAHAARAPDAVVALSHDKERTYAALNGCANQIARSLLGLQIEPDRPVAVAMTPEPDALTAMLAVMKAGLAVAPIDPTDLLTPSGAPLEAARLARIIDALRPALVIVDETTATAAAEATADVRIVSYQDLLARAADEPESEPDARVSTDTAAVLLARVDADGQVVTQTLRHHALHNVARDPDVALHAEDRVGHLGRVDTDRSFYTIFGALAVGAAVAFLPPDMAANSRRFAALIRDQGVTVLFLAAADIERLAREFPWALRKVRLLLSDERIVDWARLKQALKPAVVAKVIGLWGDPAADGFFLKCPLASVELDSPAVPMGRPLAGFRVAVLDRHGKIVPPRVPGQLWIGCQSSRDVADYAPTGAVARVEPDGQLALHQQDHEALTVTGSLIQARDIEAAIREFPGALDAAVAVRSPRGLRARGIVAFVRAEPDSSLDTLDSFLSARLPAYMIPSTLAVVDDIARTDAGQIDRRVLADLAARYDAATSAAAPYVEPRNDLETTLAQIWMEVLGSERVGIHDNFFRLGGHSLVATQMVARIGDALRIELPLQQLFEAPTIEQLAKVVEPLVGADYDPEVPTIVPVPRDRPIPLSFAQQRLWFLDQFEPGSAFYNIALPIRFPMPIDPRLLEAALNALIARHETLRTTFDVVDGYPVQIIAPELKVHIPVHDLRRLPDGSRDAETERLTALEANRPFDLKNGPVLRAELVRLGNADHLLLLTLHHIAADGWSIDIMFRELLALYEAQRSGKSAELSELTIQYADFACWQRRWLTGTVFQRQMDFWRKQLEGAPPLLELQTDRPRPAVQTFSGGLQMFVLPPAILEAVKSISEQEQVTPFTTLLAAFYVLLHRYTGRRDLVVGSPVANRVRPELETLIGFFANTLVLRTHLTPTLTFRELIARVREVTVGAYDHQDIPFEKLVEELQPDRNLSYNPLFQVMFASQNIRGPAAASAHSDDAPPVLGAGVAKFDLTVFVSETTLDIRGGIEFNSELFDPETVTRLAGHYETLLRSATEEPDRPIWSYTMLLPSEDEAITEWNDMAVPTRRCCLHALFEEQVAQAPDAPAIVFGDESVSYRELNRRANGWAHDLIAQGIGPGGTVGVCITCSVDMIAAVLAVLKAGAAYVPLDPSYPKERLAFMASDSGAAVILTQSALREYLPDTQARDIAMDGDDAPAGREDAPTARATPDDLACILYTSGSTGLPKGVAMPHAPLVSLMDWQITRSALPAAARTLQFSAFGFDVSIQEIFATLGAGGTLVLVSEAQRLDPRALWDVMIAARVQRMFLPYVALQQLAEQARHMPELPDSLREVVTAGEQLQVTGQIAALFDRLDATLYNQYGPTESHVVTELALTGPPDTWPDRPAIGRPIPNATIQILDPYGQPCAIGIPGELHIGGLALARGYYRRPDLTAERFIPDLQGAAGQRVYRTGDRALYRADGVIQFLGRLDDQVKIRGFRVELGEIEAALHAHPAVQEVAVVAREDGGVSRLAAYVQADPNEAPDVAGLRAHLAGKLPDFMIPAAFMVMARLPLTPSGKLDRRALPDPWLDRDGSASGIIARTPVEEALARIWREVLQVPNVGIDDNFFELGGHSLLATQVISRIREELGADLPVRSMFEAPTLEALALSVVESALQDREEDDMARLLADLEEMPDDEARSLVQGEQA